MTLEDLFAEADRIASDLFKVSAGLDSNIFRVDAAAKRGALTNLCRVCHDTAMILSRPCSPAKTPQ